jgi:hypothetical protein
MQSDREGGIGSGGSCRMQSDREGGIGGSDANIMNAIGI